MQPEGRQPYQPKPCKFGDNCYKYQQGNCTFFHPQQMGGGKGKGKGNPPHQYPNQNHQFPGNKQTNPHYQQKPQNQSDPILNEFCRFFQTAECTKPQCKKKHAFIKNDSLKRVVFTREMPNNEIANLGSFMSNGNNYLSLRMGNQISFYEFKPETAQLNQVMAWALPQIKSQYDFYEQKENFVYFSAQNQTTKFSDFGYYNIFNQQMRVVENAHQKRITGVVHIHSGFIATASIDGTIKIWKKDGEQIGLEKAATQAINNCFNVNTKIEITFINFKTFGEESLMTAGTSDNRLLMWFGQSMTYKQIVFDQKYTNVLRITYLQHQSAWLALVLVWDSNRSFSSIIAIALNTLEFNVIVQQEASHNKQLLCEMASVGGLLMVSNMAGTVSIYNIPQFNEKVGVIMHQNSLSSMLALYSMTSTNIPIKNLLILENTDGKSNRQGSFEVFALNE